VRGSPEAAHEDEGVIQQPIHRRPAHDCQQTGADGSRRVLNTELNTELNTDFPPCLIPEDADVIQQHIHRWMGDKRKNRINAAKTEITGRF